MKSYVFSVNQNDISVECGLLGVYLIRGAGTKFYGKTAIEDRVSPKDLGNDRFETHTDTGEAIANDIVKRNTEDGFFLAAGSEPTTEELKAAIDAYPNICVFAVR